MNRIALASLFRFDLRLPVGGVATVRLCEGGLVDWGAERFVARAAAFGSIGAGEAVEEGIGDQVPDLSLTILPASMEAAGELAQAGHQGSRVRWWIAEIDLATSSVVGTPEAMFDGMLDTVEEMIGPGAHALTVTAVAHAERLFTINEGNTLSSAFHKTVFPGELGEDNASGVGVGVAWGVPNPAGSYGAGFGGGGGSFIERFGLHRV